MRLEEPPPGGALEGDSRKARTLDSGCVVSLQSCGSTPNGRERDPRVLSKPMARASQRAWCRAPQSPGGERELLAHRAGRNSAAVSSRREKHLSCEPRLAYECSRCSLGHLTPMRQPPFEPAVALLSCRWRSGRQRLPRSTLSPWWMQTQWGELMPGACKSMFVSRALTPRQLGMCRLCAYNVHASIS